MKTTLELPDELMRRVKMQAVSRDQKLKDLIAELLERGLAEHPVPDRPAHLPRPVRLKDRGPLLINDIETAIHEGRE